LAAAAALARAKPASEPAAVAPTSFAERYSTVHVKGNKTLARFIPQSELMKYFYYRLARIQVEVGETNDAAWHRHLMENPGDIFAAIRVFNS
jgi:hypothetical protein